MTSTPETFYDLIGGETNVKTLVAAFYEIMDSNPSYKLIRNLHAKSLHMSESKLFDFLSGWLGGPPLYMNKYGHPRLRMRHLPFPIGEIERDQWLSCMKAAFEKTKLNDVLGDQNYQGLMNSFWKTADFMRNKDI